MKYLLAFIFMGLSYGIFAQVEPGVESGVFRLEKGYFDSHQVMIGRKLPPSEVKGDYYLDSNWQEGYFVMKDGRKSAKYPLRYDIENALLEIKWGETIKIAGEEYLDRFQWQDDETGKERLFIQARHFQQNGAAMAGFMELLYAGKDSLLMKPETELKQPDYVAGLDMGSRNPEILKKQRFFIAEDGKLTEINNRKDFISYAEEMSSKTLKKFIRTEGIRLKEPEDLTKLIGYYESRKDSLE